MIHIVNKSQANSIFSIIYWDINVYKFQILMSHNRIELVHNNVIS